MCDLLQLCVPLELRFVGSCLEDRVRREYRRLQDYEAKSNDLSVYDALLPELSANESIDRLLRTLSVYLSLLRSNNTNCAVRIYDLLMLLWHRIRNTTSVVSHFAAVAKTGDTTEYLNQSELDSPAYCAQTTADLALLFTLAS